MEFTVHAARGREVLKRKTAYNNLNFQEKYV